MSPARSDLVNAVELAGRAATLERAYPLEQLPRLVEAGALAGTGVHARIGFGRHEGRTTVDLAVAGSVVLPCQRCLRPVQYPVDDEALLAIVADDAQAVEDGREAVVGDAERLSLVELVEEQVLLGMPLVPLHEDEADCDAGAAHGTEVGPGPAAEETQRPFANLRELLGKNGR